jgi:hypothetical protein
MLQTKHFAYTFERGIINPAKAVRIALQDAASIAGLMITTEAGVVEASKKEAGQPDHNPWRHDVVGLGLCASTATSARMRGRHLPSTRIEEWGSQLPPSLTDQRQEWHDALTAPGSF